ncbi:hypothetical protein J4461_03365 [Candidatus Pacearchaeota archaeon]|nr:hypothetical protein [Candidatus Pacearchaeota archaeon]
MIISFIYAARPIWFTGFVTEFATINLSVESSLAINFSTDIINWGSGRVVVGADNATLNTAGVNTGGSNPSQRNGNWTNNTAGLVLENIGNALMNISINVTKNSVGRIQFTSSTLAKLKPEAAENLLLDLLMVHSMM